MKFTLKNLTPSKKTMSPPKILIYGDNGLGKSTFASKSKSPIFMNLEDNIDHLETTKQALTTWVDCLSFLDWLVETTHPFKTLVIDSLEALEQMIWKHTCKKFQAEFMDDQKVLAYGRGIAFATSQWGVLLERLNVLRKKGISQQPGNEKGMSIILIAHSAPRKYELPGEGSFDRFEPRINPKASALIADWCNCILFALKEGKESKQERTGFKKKAYLSGNTIVKTECNGGWLAKNVFDLPPEMYLDWNTFSNHLSKFYGLDKKEEKKEEKIEEYDPFFGSAVRGETKEEELSQDMVDKITSLVHIKRKSGTEETESLIHSTLGNYHIFETGPKNDSFFEGLEYLKEDRAANLLEELKGI